MPVRAADLLWCEDHRLPPVGPYCPRWFSTCASFGSCGPFGLPIGVAGAMPASWRACSASTFLRCAHFQTPMPPITKTPRPTTGPGRQDGGEHGPLLNSGYFGGGGWRGGG